MTKFKTVLVFGTILIFTGFTAYAFAHGGGYGYGRGMMNGYYMNGPGMMDGYYMNGPGHMWNNMSQEDQQLMQDEMNKFFTATKDLRIQYDEKRIELEQEYAKPEKDQAKISTLEKDLFNLSTKLEKARFDHMSEMRKLFADKGYDGGYMMGAGGFGGCHY